jgi:hypothetical protein
MLCRCVDFNSAVSRLAQPVADLRVLVGTDEKPLWVGKSAIQVREATAAQHAEWEQSRDQAISDEEIDLDAGDDPDEWSIYLTRIPQTK